MDKVWVVLIAVLIFAGGAYLLMMGNETAPATEDITQTVPSLDTEQIVALSEQNASGESGTAVLVERNGKVVVTLDTVGGPTDVPQPAHIHTGACPDVAGVVYPLTNVVNGKSETTLDVTLSELAALQPLGINIHKSVPEAKVYVSCGDLALPTATSPDAAMETNVQY